MNEPDITEMMTAEPVMGREKMIWKKLTIETSAEAVELLADFLSELGYPGAEISDNLPLSEEEMKQMYVDVPLIPEGDPEQAFVSVYLDDQVSTEEEEDLKRKLRDEWKRLTDFFPAGSGKITVTETEDDSTWQENWKNYYRPFRLEEDIVVQPVWEEYPDIRPEDTVLKISSVMAFGTGTHETTKLCIRKLREFMQPGASVFDVGCGSGILAILAVLLGAGYVHGLDIDPQAVLSSRENAEANGLSEDRIVFSAGNLLSGNVIGAVSEEEKEEYARASIGSGIAAVNPVQMVDLSLGESDPVPQRQYDIVVANILADVIIPLAKVVPAYLADGGIFITSGIQESRAEDVKKALLTEGFTILSLDQMGEWVAIAARKD